VVAILSLLVLAALVAGFLTHDSADPTSSKKSAGRPHLAQLVDERPLQTAQNMAKLTASWDEVHFSQQALHAADHEVDLAFEDALRDAANHPAPPTPQTTAMYARLNKAQAAVNGDQAQINQLNKELTAAPEARRSALQEQLDLATAQVELDQDDLDDAKEDLVRSGVDSLSRIQRQFKRHEDTEHAADATHSPTGPNRTPANYQATSLLGQIEAWRMLQAKVTQLQAARDEQAELATSLDQAHDQLDKQLAAEKAASQSPAPASPAGTKTPDAPPHSSREAIAALRRLSSDQKGLSDLDKRIQDEQELDSAYANWIALLQTHERSVVHGMIQSLLWILLIVLAVYLAGLLINRYFAEVGPERTRLHTVRVVIRFAVQTVGVLLIVLVILGTPQQMPTILGFAGAGLTVALKDFIVAFFGWFVLMGKNGLRVGDWVEIDGVAGEVIEINLLRTILLETGNWTTTGHPTGRKVAFVNSYAIEGHFFNFTTSGQWLWDELQITVPAGQDPYALVDAIQKAVTEETASNARAAEEEWERVSSRYKVRSVSANPAVNLKPTASGAEIHVRYITRAHERSATRMRLNQTLMELLRGKGIDEKSLPSVQ